MGSTVLRNYINDLLIAFTECFFSLTSMSQKKYQNIEKQQPQCRRLYLGM